MGAAAAAAAAVGAGAGGGNASECVNAVARVQVSAVDGRHADRSRAWECKCECE